jgi:hypothetical protein
VIDYFIDFIKINIGFSVCIYLLLWCSLLALLVVAACVNSMTLCVLVQGLGFVVMVGGENGRMWGRVAVVVGGWSGVFYLNYLSNVLKIGLCMSIHMKFSWRFWLVISCI